MAAIEAVMNGDATAEAALPQAVIDGNKILAEAQA
jgi:hypothetical protein